MSKKTLNVIQVKEIETKNFSLVIAEDDEDDYLLTKEALRESLCDVEVHWVKDGEELLHFLKNQDPSHNGNKPVGMILLDLNMPKKDGREVLREIKSDPKYRRIPIIVMTTSNAEIDISNTYDLGVNSYIQKPVRYAELVEVIKTLTNYWFNTAKLPF